MIGLTGRGLTDVRGGGPATDDEDFKRNPEEFCGARVQNSDFVFGTGALGGAVFTGDVDSLLGSVDAELTSVTPLDEPFADVEVGYEALSQNFNRECYRELFQWIPKYKEAGGFSTFRFDDFLDARVRSVRPSVRRLLLRATLPLVLGVSWEEATRAIDDGALESEGITTIGDLASLFDAYAQQAASSGSGLIGRLARLPFLAKASGSEARLQSALVTLVRTKGGIATDGGVLLRAVFSSVEQTGALVCNMLGQTVAHPAWDEQLAAEQTAALSGMGPEDAIGLEQLDAMPKLDAFTQETLRLSPPARPSCLRLCAPLALGGAQLAKGTLLQPEPFVAHLRSDLYPEPRRFDPDRFELGQPLPPLGFAGPTPGGAGANLATTLAKVTFVQMRRMFILRLGSDPALVPAGYPVLSVPEGCKVLAEAKMYYELQRENKKLKF